MHNVGAEFERGAEEWLAWQRTPWARIYYRLVQHVLTDALNHDGTLHVLDVGGGNAHDSLPLASRGHMVTVLDASPRLLLDASAQAKDRGLPPGQLQTVECDLDSGAPLPQPESALGWDLILCHNVLQYRSNPNELLLRITQAARPGGVLSLIAPNPAMDVLSAAIRGQDPLAGLERLASTSRQSVAVGAVMHDLDRAAAESALTSLGVTTTSWFGHRSIVDLVSDEDLKQDADWLHAAFALERELISRSPYREVARFWHLICRTHARKVVSRHPAT